MRKSLLILSALLLTGGGLSAQSQQNALKEKKAKARTEQVTHARPDANHERTAKSAAKDNSDNGFLSITPFESNINFNLDASNPTLTRPLVIRNTSDEPMEGYIYAGQKADIQLGEPYFEGEAAYQWQNRYLANYFEVGGFGYAANNDDYELVKTNLATGEFVYRHGYYDDYYSLTYDGTTFWASAGNYIVALDASLTPTGKKIYVGYYSYVTYTGTELVAVEYYGDHRVKGFDTNGNLTNDYGTLPFSVWMANYEPATGLIWVKNNDYPTAIRLHDGKATVEAIAQFDGRIVGFDNEGNPYLNYYNSYNDYEYLLFKAKKFSIWPKGISLSQSSFSLQPGEQTTINITATVEGGSQAVTIYAKDCKNTKPLFTRTINIDADLDEAYEKRVPQFAAYIGLSDTDTVWVKNTGIAPITLKNTPELSSTTYFQIEDVLYPIGFSNNKLYSDDSVGYIVRFATLATGNYAATLNVGNSIKIELNLKGTGKEYDYTVANNNPSGEIANCELTVADRIQNNMDIPLILKAEVLAAEVVFNIYSGIYGSEMGWKLLDENGDVVYNVDYSTYGSSYTNYTQTLYLQGGASYTLDMNDSYGDGWNSGYITVTDSEGNPILSNAGLSEGEHATAEFTIPSEIVESYFINKFLTIAANTSIDNFDFPISYVNESDETTIGVFVEDIDWPITTFTLTTSGVVAPELTVDEEIDLGGLYSDHTNTIVVPVTNGGCAPLTVSAIQLTGDSHNIVFYDSNNEMTTTGFSYDQVVNPGSTVDLQLAAITYGEIGAEVTDELQITTTAGNATVQLKSVNLGLPVATVKNIDKDTIPCTQTGAVTLVDTVKNTGTGTLVISEPVKISWQPGTCYNIYVSILNGDNIITDFGFSSRDKNSYSILPAGDYNVKIYNYSGGSGTLSVVSGSKTLLSVDVTETSKASFTLADADIVTHSIAAGDSVAVAKEFIPYTGNWTSAQNFSYPIATNDPNNSTIVLTGQIRVVRAPELVYPETIDFGEVVSYASVDLNDVIENTGCGEWYIDNCSFVEEGVTAFTASTEAVYFEPTDEPGTEYTATLRVSYYYNTTATVNKTFDITLKGKSIAAPQVDLDDYPVIELTAEPGDKTVSTSVTITNTGASDLIITDATLTNLYAYTGTGTRYGDIYWGLQRKKVDDNGDVSWSTVKSVAAGTYTAAGQTINSFSDVLPAGEYRLYMYDNNGYGWNNGYITIKLEDGTVLLEKAQVPSNAEYKYFYFNVAERKSYTVAPGNSADIDIEIPVEGLVAQPYPYEFITRLNTNAGDPTFQEIPIVVAVTIDEVFAYDFNKTENGQPKVVFEPVHVGKYSYSSITLRNQGTVDVDIYNIPYFKEGVGSAFDVSYDHDYVAVGDSLKFSLNFYSEDAGVFRDTLYLEHYNPIEDEYVLDTIALYAVANNTSVISVSTPFANRYAVANDTIAINVTFDGTVVVNKDEDLEAMPQMKMNTGSFAVLDSTALLDSRDDLYTLTFLYAVQSADNVALFDYAEDSVYMNYHVVEVDGSDIVDTIALPAVGTFARTFPVTIDNKAPQIAGFDMSQDGMNVDLTIKFNEEVVGFDQSGIKLTGATLNSLKTKDNITFTASVTLQPCVDITVGINATLKDLAGNSKKLSQSKEIPAIHSYTTTDVAATCTEDGYTLSVCSLCKHEEKSNTVAATGHKPGEPTIEVKVPATETTEGKCDTVIVCTVCGTELSRTEGVSPATGNGGGNINAIAENAASALIYAQDGAIVVEVAEADGCEISVIDINGRVIAKANATSTRTVIPMPTAGVYMVNFEQETTKVVLP